MPLKKSQEPTLPGHLNQGEMLNLLGYHLAQASIPTDSVFKKYINEPFQLNKLEFTILVRPSSSLWREADVITRAARV
jgi:hypothetical protein